MQISTIPASITTPMSDMTFSVVPHRKSATITPLIAGGSASMMMNGSRNERNCDKDQVEQQQRERESDSEAAEGRVHGLGTAISAKRKGARWT
jgi:hypothetical protein